jgi:hypothetical protein
MGTRWVGDPGAVEPIAGLALLVLTHLGEGALVDLESRRRGMNAAMPPIAKAPRRWQVETRRSV